MGALGVLGCSGDEMAWKMKYWYFILVIGLLFCSCVNLPKNFTDFSPLLSKQATKDEISCDDLELISNYWLLPDKDFKIFAEAWAIKQQHKHRFSRYKIRYIEHRKMRGSYIRYAVIYYWKI